MVSFVKKLIRKLTIDNSDLGAVEPRAMSGMLGVEELNIVNSKIDKIKENIISDETQVKNVRLEGNHLLAVPDDFDYSVGIQISVSLMNPLLIEFDGD